MLRCLLVSFIFFSLGVQAQFYDPVDWSFDQKEIDKNEYKLTFQAKIDAGWHLYSQHIGGTEDDIRPVPTSFNFDDNKHIEFEGEVAEEGEEVLEGPDKMFDGLYVKKYGKKAVFTQIVKVNKTTTLTGYLEYMTCNDEMCLPPTPVDFSFKLTYSEDKGQIETGENDKVALGSLQQDGPINTGLNSEPNNGFYMPANWSLTTNELEGQERELVFNVKLDSNWKVYSQYVEEGGPVPTTFHYDDSTGTNYEFIGKTEETGEHTKEGVDDIFGVFVKSFSGEATFTQKIKLKDESQPVTGYLQFMTCNFVIGTCLPPTKLFYEVNFQTGDIYLGEEIIDEEIDEDVANAFIIPSVDMDNPVLDCGQKKEDHSLWGIFILGFLGGLIALLTPCVFPMIPLTVSFFIKGSDSRKGITNAFIYGFFIFLIYVLLSVPFHFLDSINSDIFNQISTSVILNVVFFIVFVTFAFSFFGYFEITLPSKFTNRVDAASDIGGIIGIFFMALTLAIVSFSCTGPILGSLLAGALSTNGGPMQLTAGMGGFGLALALPFALFAAFPSWLNSLPKSGGWLNTIKVVVGFIELALAIKFLSNADLVSEWGLLKREIFFGFWIVIGIGLALYLFGVIKFPHDSPIKKLSAGRIAVGILTVAFVLYLIPGLTNTKYANLRLLSGFPPPLFYSIYPKETKCPLGIECHKNNYEAGLAYAQKVNKPVMIDFTGNACQNCRRMEEHIWPEDKVYKLLSEDYVLISLYVDIKTELPEDEQIVVDYNGSPRKLRTIGDRWSYFQWVNFKNNSQPRYVLISPDETLLTNPVGYTSDVSEYEDFLKCGLEAFEIHSNSVAAKSASNGK